VFFHGEKVYARGVFSQALVDGFEQFLLPVLIFICCETDA
jgi:hypothetical protein